MLDQADGDKDGALDQAELASPPRDCDPQNCSWGPGNIFSRKSRWERFLGPDNVLEGLDRSHGR
jgi:hypothetical protein